MSDLKNRTTVTTPGVSSRPPRLRSVVVTGVVATLVAMAAVAATAALAEAVGVDFELPGGEAIPASGSAVMTGIFSAVGVVIAVTLRRWSARPATAFVRVTVTLTAFSLVPPFLSGADSATVAALILLHLVAATVMIPALAHRLRG
jgi:Family of unknown function (DUF6069)